MRQKQLLATVLAATLASACASSGSSARPRDPNSGPDRISAAEIQSVPASNAFDLINRLRPQWIKSAGRVGSIGGGSVRQQVVIVVLDGTRVGTLESLRTLNTTGFQSIRYYDAGRAATVVRDPGPDPLAGAIVITTGS